MTHPNFCTVQQEQRQRPVFISSILGNLTSGPTNVLKARINCILMKLESVSVCQIRSIRREPFFHIFFSLELQPQVIAIDNDRLRVSKRKIRDRERQRIV